MHVDILEAIVSAGRQMVDLTHASNALQWLLIAFVVVGTGWLAFRSRKN